MLEDQIYRSYGILKHSRIIESSEAAKRLSNVRLGIDLGIIDHLSHTMLNELMVLMQPGFLQHYANKMLTASEDRKCTRLNSSHVAISYAVFCLKKKRCLHY